MSLQRIQHSLIDPNPDQPRKIFEPRALGELADSILENGLAQPITVRPKGDRYEIIMGERRWRAHGVLIQRGHAAFAEIKCHVRDVSDIDRDILAIIENAQRVDVTPLEDARSLQRQLDLGMSVEDLAKRIGRAPWRIEERTRLLGLDPSIIKLYEGGSLDQNVAFEMSKLADRRDQMKIAQLVNKGTLTGWKSVKAAVAAINEGKTQTDMFGDGAPKASDEDVATVNAMEAKIERMAALAAAGWKDGECVVAVKVSRDRARLMADKIAAMRVALLAMQRELQASAAQAEVVFDVADAA